MNIFLKAKHWQLFAAFYGFLLFMQIVYPVFIYNVIVNKYAPEPQTMMQFAFIFIALALLSTIAMYGWIISISLGLKKLFPENVEYNFNRFKFFLISLFVSMVLMIVFVFVMVLAGDFIEHSPVSAIVVMILMFLIILPIAIYMSFCQVYISLCAARSYKTALLQKEVKFKECIGIFFLLYFSMVGVWILQPKINKLYEGIKGE